jgi:isopentenyl diphosphate isomerase/L-lactate dehydrogenase-like FMN-dependent dehydrogenase
MSNVSASRNRREFLKFLAGSPCLQAMGGMAALLGTSPLAAELTAEAKAWLPSTPAEALTVFDFEEVAHRNVMAGHWAYMQSGVDLDVTLRANRDGYSKVQLRPRRLRDATKVDMRVDLWGTTYASPIFTCPTGGERSIHSDGELGVARAAKKRNTMQMLSTSTSTPIEEVNAALGRPVWYQLYAPGGWPQCEQMLKRVAASGVSVIALTVDNTTGRFSESYLRNRPRDMTQCSACHKGEPPGEREYPMLVGIDMKGVKRYDPAMDWNFVDRIRGAWKGKFVIKGIDTREDAALCLQHGIDGILVSNHGGRSTDTGRATIEALPEVIAEVKGRIPVFVDGGVRRGTDVFKALALGATAVGIGRPFLWGLGAFGEAGVDRVLEIMQAELKLAMGNCGTRTVGDITKDYVATRF